MPISIFIDEKAEVQEVKWTAHSYMTSWWQNQLWDKVFLIISLISEHLNISYFRETMQWGRIGSSFGTQIMAQNLISFMI